MYSLTKHTKKKTKNEQIQLTGAEEEPQMLKEIRDSLLDRKAQDVVIEAKNKIDQDSIKKND